jgi:hypothetical protein
LLIAIVLLVLLVLWFFLLLLAILFLLLLLVCSVSLFFFLVFSFFLFFLFYDSSYCSWPYCSRCYYWSAPSLCSSSWSSCSSCSSCSSSYHMALSTLQCVKQLTYLQSVGLIILYIFVCFDFSCLDSSLSIVLFNLLVLRLFLPLSFVCR